MNGERRRIARRPELHRFERADLVRNRNQALAVDACVLGIAAIDGFAEAGAINEHVVAGLPRRVVGTDDDTGEIDAAIERIVPEDLSLAGRCKRVFVIDG